MTRPPEVRHYSSSRRAGHKLLVLFLALSPFGSALLLRAQQTTPVDANQLARDIFQNEVDAQQHDTSLWSYRELDEEDGKRKLFAVCEIKNRQIKRLLAINDQPLSPKQRQEEDQHIGKLLSNSDQLSRQEKKQHEDAEQAMTLMKMFPDAFEFQFEDMQGNLAKLKFTPNPSFRPETRAARVFHHMEGTVVLDVTQRRIAEVDGRLTSEVKFGGGILGHLDKGGTFSVKQQDLGSGHWEMSYLNVQMNGRALFFHTIAVRQKQLMTNFRHVPDDITSQQAAELVAKEITQSAKK
jgi:hypothetical protein